MSEREGNTDAPRVDENEVRADDREGSGPRRLEEVRRDREEERGSRSGAGVRYVSPDEHRGTSWVSVVLGWLAALGAGLILSGIVSGIVGAIFGTAGRQGIVEGGTTALVGLLITLLLAFLVGGYAAGRRAARSGLKHGLLASCHEAEATKAAAFQAALWFCKKAQAAGSFRRNTAPPLLLFSARRSPPWARVSPCAMESPSPVPPVVRLLALSAR